MVLLIIDVSIRMTNGATSCVLYSDSHINCLFWDELFNHPVLGPLSVIAANSLNSHNPLLFRMRRNKNHYLYSFFFQNPLVVNEFLYICTPIFELMGSQNKLEIPFEGLKVGKHTFQFNLTDAFFDDIAHSIIDKGSIQVEILLDKKENIMTGDFKVNGFIQSPCDRCNDLVSYPLNFEHRLIFKFGEEASEDEDLIIIPPNEYKIRLSPILHELLTVEVPPRLVHEENECNQEMLDLLDEYAQSSSTTSSEEEDIDPRWEALKKIKNN